jgi:transposase
MEQEADPYRWYVGIDWATEAHEVCVLDSSRREISKRSVDHNGPALASFVEWLAALCKADVGHVAVSIEIPRGAIVETLVERGFHVYAINPKQLDRFRDRHTVAGAKDDRRDAFVLADSLCTDRHAFRQVRVDDPIVIQLREASRMDEDLGGEMNRLTNRMREQLHRYFAQALALCPSADEPWLWSLLELAPTPESAGRLGRKRVEKLLHEHRIRRIGAEEVIAELRREPLHVAPGTIEAASAHVAMLIPRLRLVREQRLACERRIESLLTELAAKDPAPGQTTEHRDVQILQSLVGVGKRVAAAVLAEASQPLAERDYHALRSLAGIAPVTRQSGKRKQVIMRQACNGRLRNALYHWARVAVMHDDHSTSVYAALRARGQTHGRALRSVADRQLRILVAMLKTRTLYDPMRTRRLPPGTAQVPA